MDFCPVFDGEPNKVRERCLINYMQTKQVRVGFLSWSMAKTLGFHCRGASSLSGLGTRILHATANDNNSALQDCSVFHPPCTCRVPYHHATQDLIRTMGYGLKWQGASSEPEPYTDMHLLCEPPTSEIRKSVGSRQKRHKESSGPGHRPVTWSRASPVHLQSWDVAITTHHRMPPGVEWFVERSIVAVTAHMQ